MHLGVTMLLNDRLKLGKYRRKGEVTESIWVNLSEIQSKSQLKADQRYFVSNNQVSRTALPWNCFPDSPV